MGVRPLEWAEEAGLEEAMADTEAAAAEKVMKTVRKWLRSCSRLNN